MFCGAAGCRANEALAVAEHYYHFDGLQSCINDQNRELVRLSFGRALACRFIGWGNRNWHPMLADTVRQMRDDGNPPRLGLRYFCLCFLFRMPPIS